MRKKEGENEREEEKCRIVKRVWRANGMSERERVRKKKGLTAQTE